MKFAIIILWLCQIAHACDFKFKEDAEAKIELNSIGNNFLTAVLTFPSLDEVFDCVALGDVVEVEVLFGSRGAKAEPLTNLTLMFKGPVDQEKRILDVKDRDKVEPCKEYKIVLKPRWNNKKGKKLKLKDRLMGPDVARNIKIENITSNSAMVSWEGDICPGDSNGFVFTSSLGSKSIQGSDLTFEATGLSPCSDNDIKIYPLFETKRGIPSKEAIKTFPSMEMVKVNFGENIEIDPDEIKSCSFQRVDYLMSFKNNAEQDDGGETSFKENLQPHELAMESITLEEIEKKLTHLQLIKRCTSYTMNITMKFRRGEHTFFIILVQDHTITTDSDRKVHMTDEVFCNRGGRTADEDDQNEEIIVGLDDIERLLRTDPPEMATKRAIVDARLTEPEKSKDDLIQSRSMDLPAEFQAAETDSKLEVKNHEDSKTGAASIAISATAGILILIVIVAFALLMAKRNKKKSQAVENVTDNYVFGKERAEPYFLELGKDEVFELPEEN